MRKDFMGMKKKIFIVDDDIAIHRLIAAVISSDVFEIIQAFDGRDIVKRIEKECPDLVILDVMMPIRDGRDICRDIRENPKTKNIKILMLSAKSAHHEKITGLEAGADDYITKPFLPELIANKISAMCGLIG
jgi:DNA-binding response OmpR family regulator